MSKLYSIQQGQVISFDSGLGIDTIGHKKESIIPGKPEKEAYKNGECVNTLTNPILIAAHINQPVKYTEKIQKSVLCDHLFLDLLLFVHNEVTHAVLSLSLFD